jgi:hypothetical protein
VHQLTLLRASAIALAARMAVDGVDIASGVSAAAASKPLPEVVSGSAPDVDAALAIDHPAQEEKS